MYSGLSEKEALSKLKLFGENIIDKDNNSRFKAFLHQLANPFIALLITAVIISAFLHNYLDAFITAFIIIVNALLGFLQEYKANDAYQKLKNLISSEVEVLRDGKKIFIEKK